MKNLLIAIVFVSGVTGVFAQEAADKKIQAGLVLGYGLNFQKLGTKYLQSNGVGGDMTIGANLNFSFTETIGFSTGVEFDFETLKYSAPAGDSVFYAYNASDNNLIRIESDADALALDGSESYYMLSTRKQKPLFITIPTMLMFRTKFIGYFRYFGKFGLRTSILVSNKFTDTGNNIDASDLSVVNTDDNKDMKAKNEMFPIKSAVGLSGGAEWNFTGSTVLMAEIGYYYGFTPLYNKRTYMVNAGGPNNTDPDGNSQYFANKATQSQLMFKVSVLF
ncbi:MAG: outer membrane beta-barrel protein [Crocinitomicaceae bacterium]|nr:outer membrane beta-barrel protein [Crocinitomicaceae bacterium]